MGGAEKKPRVETIKGRLRSQHVLQRGGPKPRGPLMEQISEKEKVRWGWGQGFELPPSAFAGSEYTPVSKLLR